MATRFYLPSTGTPAITPAFHAGWEQTTAADRIEMDTVKQSTSFATKADSETSSSNTYDVLLRQYISKKRYQAYTFTTSHSFKLQVRCLESNANANFLMRCRIAVIQNDGTLRGDLETGSIDGTEFDAEALENRKDGWTFSSGASMLDGDRMLIEIGFRATNTKTTSYTGTMDFGDNSGTDLPEDDTDQNQYNPWFEISENLVEYTPPSAFIPRIIMF